MMRQFLAILVGSGLILMGSAAFAGQENSGDRVAAPITQQVSLPAAESVTAAESMSATQLVREHDVLR